MHYLWTRVSVKGGKHLFKGTQLSWEAPPVAFPFLSSCENVDKTNGALAAILEYEVLQKMDTMC